MFELHGFIYPQILTNKQSILGFISMDFVSACFTSADSTDLELKPVFWNSQPQLLSRRFSSMGQKHGFPSAAG